MTQISQKGCAFITGAGGRLGRLLLAARDDARDKAQARPGRLLHDMVFQSRRPGADIQWSPGHSMTDLPRASAVIALWGVTSGGAGDLAANADLVALSTDLARHLGARKVVHMSSAAVYGPGRMMGEDHPTGHCSDYGKSKLAMEQAVAGQRRTGDLTHLCLRLANVVGADSLAPALRRKDPAMMDDFGHDPAHPVGPIRSYIGAGGLLQVLDALLALPDGHWPDVLNVACPTPFAMDDLLRAAGKDVIWRPAPASATAEVTLDVARLQGLLPNLTLGRTAKDLITEWRRLESRA